RLRKPPAHPELSLRLSQQQQTAMRRLIAASKINCEFLAPDRWKLEGKQRIVAHGGCGGGLIRIAIRWNTDLLRESLVSCHSCLISSPSRIIRASSHMERAAPLRAQAGTSRRGVGAAEVKGDVWRPRGQVEEGEGGSALG